MAVRKINYDRGVVKKIHPSGVHVYMYLDEPGVYRNAFEQEVGEKLAEVAGFNIAELGRMRQKNLRMAEFAQALEKEMAIGGITEELVLERAGYKIYSIGLGRHVIRDEEDNTLTPTPLPKEQAVALLDAMVPEKAKPKGEATAKA